MDSSTDFVELASRIHTQSCDAAGSDTERVTIRSLESVDPDSLSTLLEVAENDGAAPSDLVFVLADERRPPHRARVRDRRPRGDRLRDTGANP